MNTPDVPAEVAPEAAPEAPPEAPAADPAAEAPAGAPADAPEAIAVVPQQPSSAATEAPAEAPASEPVSIEDAARAVVIFVEAHRTIGDSDLAAAIDDLKAALPAQA
jgi:hypothetical protein